MLRRAFNSVFCFRHVSVKIIRWSVAAETCSCGGQLNVCCSKTCFRADNEYRHLLFIINIPFVTFQKTVMFKCTVVVTRNIIQSVHLRLCLLPQPSLLFVLAWIGLNISYLLLACILQFLGRLLFCHTSLFLFLLETRICTIMLRTQMTSFMRFHMTSYWHHPVFLI